MADKFTRTGVAEGDVLYATTASSSKSVESLEDSIDDKLLTYIGSALTAASTTSSTEVELSEVTVSANSVRTGVLVIASLKGKGAVTQNFILRIGESTTATSNTNAKQVSISPSNDSSTPEVGHTIMYWYTGATWTNTNYVTITGYQGAGGPSNGTVCESLIVLGI